jgi:HlyD family secretion protein
MGNTISSLGQKPPASGPQKIAAIDVDQLGALSHLTFPRAWAAVLTLAVLIAGLVVWSFVGIIYTHVSGLGIALPRSGNLQRIETNGAGPVARVFIRPGQRVKAGDKLILLDQVVVSQQVASARKDVQIAQAVRDQRAAALNAQTAAMAASTEAQIAALNAKITSLNGAIAFRTRYLADLRSELGQGYTTRSAVEQARLDLVQSQLDLKQAQNQIQQANIQQSEAVANAAKELAQLDDNVLKAQETLASNEAQLNLASGVVAPFDGLIVSVSTVPGDVVTIGQPVATIAPEVSGLEVVAFFQVGDGKRIQPGAAALIAFDSVDPDVYGTAVGKVTDVSQVPASPETLMNLLGNPNIIKQLTGDFAPLVARVALAGEPGPIQFSSGLVPPVAITAGTTARLSVTVERDHPVAFVIPFFRMLTGS